MQDAGEQQRLVMPVVVPPTAGCFTAEPRDDLHHVPVDRIAVRGGRAWPVAHAQPFGDELAGHVDEINVFPHVEQRGAGSQQSYEQFTRFVRPVAVADMGTF